MLFSPAQWFDRLAGCIMLWLECRVVSISLEDFFEDSIEVEEVCGNIQVSKNVLLELLVQCKISSLLEKPTNALLSD